MTHDRNPDQNDDHRDDHRDENSSDEHDDSCTCLDMQQMRRLYRVALADSRLGRGSILWPRVAGVVDAAFMLGDPVRASDPDGNPDTHEVYAETAVGTWADLISAMFESLGLQEGDEHRGVMRLSEVQVRDIIGNRLIEEFETEDDEDDEDDYVSEVQFAEIINQEFGVTIPVGTPTSRTATRSVPAPGSTRSIDWDRVDLMVRLVHARLAEFPWEHDEPF